MERKNVRVPGEVSQAWRSKGNSKGNVVTTNCEKSAEAIVPQKREGPNNRKSEERRKEGQCGESGKPRE